MGTRKPENNPAFKSKRLILTQTQKLKEQDTMKTIKLVLAALALAALPVALNASDACKKCCKDNCAACCKDKGKTCGKDCCKGE